MNFDLEPGGSVYNIYITYTLLSIIIVIYIRMVTLLVNSDRHYLATWTEVAVAMETL
jgi:hypothetical protein